MKAEEIARTITLMTTGLKFATPADEIVLRYKIVEALRAAEARGEARGYERAKEQAVKVATNEGVSPETNSNALWYQHARRIATAIRNMQPEDKT